MLLSISSFFPSLKASHLKANLELTVSPSYFNANQRGMILLLNKKTLQGLFREGADGLLLLSTGGSELLMGKVQIPGIPCPWEGSAGQVHLPWCTSTAGIFCGNNPVKLLLNSGSVKIKGAGCRI